MFCKECGTENTNEATFCEKCGTSLKEDVKNEVNNKVDKTVLKHNIKPIYNWGYKIITIGLSSVIFALILIFYIFEEFTFMIMSGFSIFILGGIALYVGLRLLFEKLQYDKLDFNFYSDRMEYKDGFLNITEKELKYKFIRETTMTQNILERLFKIGTIRIFTNASSGMGAAYGKANNMKMQQNGILIHCVNNVKEEYEAIKKIIDEGTED